MPPNQGLEQQNGRPRGAMSAYSIFIQTCREEHRLRYPFEAVTFIAFTRRCNMRWRTMTDQEKSRFCEMAKADKVRFEAERRCLLGAAAGGSGRRARDPEAPKRPMCAFFWFTQEVGPGVRAANPHFNLGEVSKVLGKLWSDMTVGQKAPYEAKAVDGKARYQKELAEYQKNAEKDNAGVDNKEAAKEVDEAQLVEAVQQDVDEEMEDI